MSRVLHVRVIEAKNLPNMDAVGKSDPYVALQLGDSPKVKTDVKQDTLSPKWNQDFSFPIVDPNATLHIIVYDEDVASDDKMGKLDILLSSLKNDDVVDQWYPLKSASVFKKGGEIHLLIHICDADKKPFK